MRLWQRLLVVYHFNHHDQCCSFTVNRFLCSQRYGYDGDRYEWIIWKTARLNFLQEMEPLPLKSNVLTLQPGRS